MAIESPFSKRLKEARTRAGLTQAKLGILAGIDVNNASAKMNQYKKGGYTPKYDRLEGIASALGLSPAYFYAESDDMAELIYHYCQLSGDSKHSALKNIKSLHSK